MKKNRIPLDDERTIRLMGSSKGTPSDMDENGELKSPGPEPAPSEAVIQT